MKASRIERRISASKRKALVLAASAVLASGLAVQRANAIPIFYSDNFDSGETIGTVPTNWTVGPNGLNSTGFLVGTLGAVSSPNAFIESQNLTSFTGVGTSTIAAVRDTATISAPIAGNNFVVTTDFVMNTFVSGHQSSSRYGITALSNTPGAVAGGAYLFDYYWDNGNTSSANIRIAGGNALSGAGSTTFAGNLTPTVGHTYLETLTGTYVGSTLDLVASVKDLSTGASIVESQSDTTPATGGNFGLTGTVEGAAGPSNPGIGGNVSISYDNFELDAVPEPASLALLGLGGLGLLKRKRSTE